MIPACMVLWSSLEHIEHLRLNMYYRDKPKLSMAQKLVIYSLF